MHPIIEKIVNILNKEYSLFGVFLIGSQNYNLDLEDSDFDTAAVVLPTIGNLYYDDKYIKEKTVAYEEGICKIIDIRDFYKGLTKSNLNYIELLFSKEYWVEEEYEKYYEYLRRNRNIVGTIDKAGLLNCAVGMMNTLHKKNIDWTTTNKTGHYNSYHILRMCNFIFSLAQGKDLDNCFISQEVFSENVIKDFKENGLSNPEIIDMIECMIEIVRLEANKLLSSGSLNTKESDLRHLREVFNDILDTYFDF